MKSRHGFVVRCLRSMAGARSATAFAPSSRIRLISPRLASVGAKELHKIDVKLLKSLESAHFLRGRD
jgi:hypothetical protein